jgi:co-chaperonin GroES (HSP10)
MKGIKPSKNRVVVKVLVEANEKKTAGGIIIPDAKNVTKEIAQGRVVAIDDPEDVSGCKVDDIILFRSMAVLQCGDGIGIISVNHVEGTLAQP